MGVKKYRNGFKVTVHDDALDKPRKLKKPQIIFVNSMGDLFHDDVPDEFIGKVFEIMETCPRHVFQVLTKRSHRLRELAGSLPWPNNVWMGVTVENSRCLYRVDDLLQTGAYIKWLSCEPLLGPLDNLDLSHIDWVAVGGESGPGARPMDETWVLDLRDRCQANDVAFCFSHWGGVNKKKTGRLLEGKIYDEMPDCPQFVSGQVSLF